MKAFKTKAFGEDGVWAFLGWVFAAGVAVTVILGAGAMFFLMFGSFGWALAAGAATAVILGAGWMFLAGAAVNSSLEDLAQQQTAEADETSLDPSDEKNSQWRLLDPTSETRTAIKPPDTQAQGDASDRKEGHDPTSSHSGVAM